MRIATDVALLAGTAAIVYGVYQLEPAIAWIVGGGFALVGALAVGRARAAAAARMGEK